MRNDTNTTAHQVTVDPTKLDAAGHFTYTDEKGNGAYSLTVHTGHGVVWTLSPNHKAADRSKVHLFMFFPPGNSPFAGEAFHTPGSTAGTTSATVSSISKPPRDFKYCVAIMDLNEMPPKVLTDDPIISHSGS
jgi:hypothetical protein